MTRPYLRQGDDDWKTRQLGVGDSTFWGAGCLLMCLTETAADFGTIQHRDPVMVNDLLVAGDAYIGSGLIVPKAAGILGLRAGPRVEQSVSVMGRMVEAYLASGRHLLLHVDRDHTLPDGDPGADHWVRAIRVSTEGIVCSDPAVGEATVLSSSQLSGPAQWGKQRMFFVRGFRTLVKA